MKTLLAIAATGLLALSAPAFAQDAGAPGAIGTGGSLTGSNPGTGWGPDGPNGDRINPGPSAVYPDGPDGGTIYLNEGRAAAPDMEPGDPDAPSLGGPRARTMDDDGDE